MPASKLLKLTKNALALHQWTLRQLEREALWFWSPQRAEEHARSLLDPAFVAQLEARASQMWASGRYAAWSFEGHTSGDASALAATGHEACCSAVELKGCVVASGGTDNTARLWDARSCRCLRTVAHPAPVESVTLREVATPGATPGGLGAIEDIRLATGDAEGTIRVGAGSSGECLHTPNP